MKRAVGYIRRSTNDTGGHVSKEEQQRVCAELAERHGEALGQAFEDWGRSGGDSHDESDALAHRPGFRALLRAVEAGEVSAVFAHRVDRLGRSSSALGRLWATSKAAGTRVITTEGDFSDDDDPATFLMRHTFEGFSVYYLKEQMLEADDGVMFEVVEDGVLEGIAHGRLVAERRDCPFDGLEGRGPQFTAYRGHRA